MATITFVRKTAAKRDAFVLFTYNGGYCGSQRRTLDLSQN